LPVGNLASLDEVYHIDREARAIAAEMIAKRAPGRVATERP
jgi:hypothetical protein